MKYITYLNENNLYYYAIKNIFQQADVNVWIMQNLV